VYREPLRPSAVPARWPSPGTKVPAPAYRASVAFASAMDAHRHRSGCARPPTTSRHRRRLSHHSARSCRAPSLGLSKDLLSVTRASGVHSRPPVDGLRHVAATRRGRSAFVVPPHLDGLLLRRFRGLVASRRRPWGSPGFRPAVPHAVVGRRASPPMQHPSEHLPEKQAPRHRRPMPPRRYQAAAWPASRPCSSREAASSRCRCRHARRRVALMGFPLLKPCVRRPSREPPEGRLRRQDLSTLPAESEDSSFRADGCELQHPSRPVPRSRPRRQLETAGAVSASSPRPKARRPGPAWWLGHRTPSGSPDPVGLQWRLSVTTRHETANRGRSFASSACRRGKAAPHKADARLALPNQGRETSRARLPRLETPHRDTGRHARHRAMRRTEMRRLHLSRSSDPCRLFRPRRSRDRTRSRRPASRLAVPRRGPKPRCSQRLHLVPPTSLRPAP
jgi:hypothetical protein